MIYFSEIYLSNLILGTKPQAVGYSRKQLAQFRARPRSLTCKQYYNKQIRICYAHNKYIISQI